MSDAETNLRVEGTEQFFHKLRKYQEQALKGIAVSDETSERDAKHLLSYTIMQFRIDMELWQKKLLDRFGFDVDNPPSKEPPYFRDEAFQIAWIAYHVTYMQWSSTQDIIEEDRQSGKSPLETCKALPEMLIQKMPPLLLSNALIGMGAEDQALEVMTAYATSVIPLHKEFQGFRIDRQQALEDKFPGVLPKQALRLWVRGEIGYLPEREANHGLFPINADTLSIVEVWRDEARNALDRELEVSRTCVSRREILAKHAKELYGVTDNKEDNVRHTHPETGKINAGFGEIEVKAAVRALLADEQWRVCELMLDGYDVKSIAEKLGKTEGTVKATRSAIRKKLLPLVDVRQYLPKNLQKRFSRTKPNTPPHFLSSEEGYLSW